jgi:hypothetical protein
LTKRKAFYREANYPFTQEKLDWMKLGWHLSQKSIL